MMTEHKSGWLRLPVATLAGMTLLSASACETEKHFDPPDRAERIEEAEVLFRAARFDTISWQSEDVRAQDGNAVYAAECRNCHGTLGDAGTEYAVSRDLDVPSLVDEDWHFAGSIDSVRQRVFVGHAEGMPTWGVAGITNREIDAVSFYILERLRPEVLGGG